MPDYSLVPVNHQPDFDDYSLIPVDHDPFGADGATQQAQVQLAQAQPQQQPAAGVGQPDADAPAASGDPSGSIGGGIGATGRVRNPTLDQGAAKAAPYCPPSLKNCQQPLPPTPPCPWYDVRCWPRRPPTEQNDPPSGGLRGNLGNGSSASLESKNLNLVAE